MKRGKTSTSSTTQIILRPTAATTNLFYSEDVSLAWEVWQQRKWYHPEEFLPSCWRVVDPDGNLMTIAEVFASSMTHYGSHGKVKGIPEEWRR